MFPALPRLTVVGLLAPACLVFGYQLRDDVYHVRPGESIQEAIDAAAADPRRKEVRVHAGTYRPSQPGQALIWFNRQHDGVQVRAVGKVTLTAANPDISDASKPSHPAVVNHVVYFGDGITNHTVLDGFRITGAKNFVTTNFPEDIEPDTTLVKGLFFFCDGGGIKIFGRSYPTLRNLVIEGNYASPCAGGISVEHDGHGKGTAPGAVVIVNSVFRRNLAQVTGAALDLLPGSHAVVSNCLFTGNAANTGRNYIAPNPAKPEFTNSAPLTVFPDSRAVVRRCTFAGNRNAVDDYGRGSLYENSIFWNNTLGGGHYTRERYDLDLAGAARVTGCWFDGAVKDPHGWMSPERNHLNARDPRFDAAFRPRGPAYRDSGYRPPPGSD